MHAKCTVPVLANRNQRSLKRLNCIKSFYGKEILANERSLSLYKETAIRMRQVSNDVVVIFYDHKPDHPNSEQLRSVWNLYSSVP